MESGEFKSGKTRVFGCEFVQSFMGGPEECIIPPGHTRFLTNADENDGNHYQEEDDRRNLAVVTKKILVVRVITADETSTTADEAALASNVFDDEVNVAKQYKACSHGQLNFIKADNRALTGTDDGDETNITNGVTTVKIPGLVDQGPDTMNNAITLALKQNFGVSSPNQLAHHVMYCFPPGTMGGIAYGYVDHWNTNYNNQWCGYLSTQMHEIGHNLNLGHSDEGPDEYADQTGMVSDGKILTDSILYKDMTLTTVLMHKFLLADGVLLWRG
jgi:hypothetical protein